MLTRTMLELKAATFVERPEPDPVVGVHPLMSEGDDVLLVDRVGREVWRVWGIDDACDSPRDQPPPHPRRRRRSRKGNENSVRPIPGGLDL